MKAACLWFSTSCGLALAAFAGCGGTSGTSEPSNDGGNGGNGTSQGGSGATSAGKNAGGAASSDECATEDCGPQLGLPNWTCEDGTLGGPTGRCLEADGVCGWEVRDCPPAGAAGAGNDGGQSNAGGSGGASSDPCGGCDTSALEICVYQVGGPGPSRFTCATQNPCGAAGACACIVDQGTCQDTPMGEPPGYCVCDNGLD